MPTITPAQGALSVPSRVGVHVERGQRAQLEEGRPRVQQHLHAVARQQLAARRVLGARRVATAQRGLDHLCLEVVDHRAHGLGIGLEVGGTGVELCLQDRHGGIRCGVSGHCGG
jgi:hypothetical protein